MKKGITLIYIILFYFLGVNGQTSEAIIDNLKRHVYTIADDSMQGRNTGTKGAEMAANYIVQQFKEIGLSSRENYLQEFSYSQGKKYLGENKLFLDDVEVKLFSDFEVLNYSANGTVNSETVDINKSIINQSEGKGKVFIINTSKPILIDNIDKSKSPEDLIEYAIKNGAVGIVFYAENPEQLIKSNLAKKVKQYDIPILVYNGKEQLTNLKKVRTIVNLSPDTKISQNIVGEINNGAKETIIVGAHYDHLGFGENGNSLSTELPAIHNGADDNASGVASVIEIARIIMTNKEQYNKYNYLFICFAGEELGLFGSKSFVDNVKNQINAQNINCMINLDMVGRLSYDKEKNLEINGVGSSPTFDTILSQITEDNIRVKKGVEGIGPSDHTSFYLQGIPVLHFFTGQHADYHKPSDDSEKINFEGMRNVINYILKTISNISNREKLVYSKTKDESTDNRHTYKVTLGIIPDYMYDGKGLRIDGVSEGKPAKIAGILKGDIVLKLGTISVEDMSSYIKALSSFSKGESTEVVILRNNKKKKLKITF